MTSADFLNKVPSGPEPPAAWIDRFNPFAVGTVYKLKASLAGQSYPAKGVMMNGEAESQAATTSPFLKQAGIAAALLLVGFLLAFVPMWLSARESATRLSTVEHELFITGMNHTLASAAIVARRGHYEPARQATSRFYSSLQTEVDRGTASLLTQEQRRAMQPLLAKRDEIITLLARSDPAGAERLSDVYVAYRRVIDGG